MLNGNTTQMSTEQRSLTTSLDLRKTEISPQDLATLPVRYPLLRELKLIDCHISADHHESLAGLTALTRLTSLNLAGNDIGDVGTRALTALTGLASLELRFNRIGADGAQALTRLTGLTFLSLCSNYISIDGARALTALTGLTSLSLRNNKIGVGGVRALVPLTGLISLNLFDNNIGDYDAQALAALTGLTSLNLSDNRIGNVGVRALLQHPRLVDLSCRMNHIDASFVQTLKQHVKTNLQLARHRLLEILILLTQARQSQDNVWFGLPTDVMLIILGHFKAADTVQYQLTPEQVRTTYQSVNAYCQKNPPNEIAYPFSRLPRLLEYLNPAQTTNAPTTYSSIAQHGMFGDRAGSGVLAITQHTTGVQSTAITPNQATPAHDARITTGIATLQMQCDDYINNNAEALKTLSSTATPEQQSTHARVYESGCVLVKTQCAALLANAALWKSPDPRIAEVKRIEGMISGSTSAPQPKGQTL
jgi:hypothetical protein